MPATAQQQAAVSDQALIGPGKTTYAQKCWHCHGPNMVTAGTVAPDLRGVPGRQRAVHHDGEAGQEQHAAVEGHSERSGDHRDLGLCIEPEEAMKRWLAVAAALLATAARRARTDDPLKVCLDENLPPLSMHQRGKPDSGFDVALAQAVAGASADRSRSNGLKASSTKARARPSKPMRCSPTAAARWSAAMSSPRTRLWYPASRRRSCRISRALPATTAAAACRSACLRRASPMFTRR